jgi:heme/copper-type cytochrome/quinol oxidase subunit 2/plastocyanin
MRPAFAFLAAATALLTLLAAPVQAGFGMPEALTERGRIVERLYDIIAVLGILVFVIVFAWLVAVIVRFRETSGHGRATHERERHNNVLEAIWIGVPLVIVLGIGYLAYEGLVELDRGVSPEDADMEILIVGSQWNWLADYGSGVRVFADPDATSGHVVDEKVFVVPAGKDILLNITSSDVIHAFNIMDANYAYFTMNDANPSGTSKHNLQVVRFEPGNYTVQCKEMCLNPGHAYMRARFSAVPEPQYERWFSERKAAGDANIVQRFRLEARDGALVQVGGGDLSNLTLAAKTRVVVDLAPPAQDVTLSATGAEPRTIRAGERTDTFYAFDLEEPGTFTLTASTGGSVTFTAVEAIAKTVLMGTGNGFRFDPAHLDLEVGKTYLITVPNVHSATHDLHIGTLNGGNGDVVVARSPSVGANGSGAFLVTPTEAGEFDMWCSQPGHVGLGMVGTVTVA